MVFDRVMKVIDNRQPSDGGAKTCEKPMVWNGKCDTCHANWCFLEIGAAKLVVFSSKTVISRWTCFKKLSLRNSFSEPFFDGACLCIVNLIMALVFLIKKRYPFHVFS